MFLGCEVVVSGKLRGQRAKSMKFVDGLMIHSGDPCNDYVDTATRHVLLRQGVLGIKVIILIYLLLIICRLYRIYSFIHEIIVVYLDR